MIIRGLVRLVLRLVSLTLALVLLFLIGYFIALFVYKAGWKVVPILLIARLIMIRVSSVAWLYCRYYTDGSSTLVRIEDPAYYGNRKGPLGDEIKKWLLLAIRNLEQYTDFGKSTYSFRFWGNERPLRYLRIVMPWTLVELSIYLLWYLGYFNENWVKIYYGWISLVWFLFFLSVLRTKTNKMEWLYGNVVKGFRMYRHQLFTKISFGIVHFPQRWMKSNFRLRSLLLVVLTLLPLLIILFSRLEEGSWAFIKFDGIISWAKTIFDLLKSGWS